MNKYKLWSLLFMLPLAIGCVDRAEVEAYNKASLSSDGKYIGNLKDGREVRQFTIDNGDRYHYMYVIENTDYTTVNRTVQSGKVSHNVTEITINGKKYIEKKE